MAVNTAIIKKIKAQVNGSVGGGMNVVRYTPQSRTEDEKARARENIGAISADEVPEPKQADWMQNDSTAEDYIKNRTHYKARVEALCSETSVDLLTHSVGDIIPLVVGANKGAYIHNSTVTLGTEDSGYRPIIRETTYNTSFGREVTHDWNMDHYTTVDIISDAYLGAMYSKVCRIIWQGRVLLYEVYFIVKPDNLFEEYKPLFPETGVYLKYIAKPSYASRYLNVSLETFNYDALSSYYLPRTTERNTNKVTEITSESTDTEYPSAGAVYRAIESAGVQADYLQEDETAANYIKHKPFGDTFAKLVHTMGAVAFDTVILMETDEFNKILNPKICTIKVKDEKIYHVNFDTSNSTIGDVEKDGISLSYALGANRQYIIRIYKVSDKYSGVSIYSISLYQEIPEELPARYLPMANNDNKSGLFTATVDSYDENTMDEVIFDVNNNSKLYSYKTVAFFDQLDFGAVSGVKDNKLGIAKAIGNAGEALGLTDDDAPFMFYPCESYFSNFPVTVFLIQSTSGRIFKAEWTLAFTQRWLSYSEVTANSGLDFGITGAETGQMLVIAEVNDEGVPIEWGTTDFTIWQLYEALEGHNRAIEQMRNAFNYVFYVNEDSDGNPDFGTAGQYAVSDGEGGITWSDGVIINSSTEGSTKKFRLTVDDSGTISATEVV